MKSWLSSIFDSIRRITSGFEIYGRIGEPSEVPVIMYSGLGSEAEKV
jgi:hypothetical protein